MPDGRVDAVVIKDDISPVFHCELSRADSMSRLLALVPPSCAEGFSGSL